MARAAPTTRGSRCVPPLPGMTASRTSGSPSLAVSDAIRMSQHSASSSPPPSAWPSMAAIVGIGSSASWRQTSWLELVPLAARLAALVLELADVRAGRERALAAPADDDRPDVVGGRLDRPERVAKLEDELAGDEVERRVDQLEVGDPAELERDELAHDAAPKSAARPIGPVA